MGDIFGEAWSAAQKMIGPDAWEQLPDAIRVHAVYEQVRGMRTEQTQGRPLFEDVTGGSEAS
jgi:hypothetical protein